LNLTSILSLWNCGTANRRKLFLEFSHLDIVCFEQFVAQFVQDYPEDIHIIQVDQGRFYSSECLQVSALVILLFQPPHSPEVNPIKRLWKEIKKT